jgi:hypothetical protein
LSGEAAVEIANGMLRFACLTAKGFHDFHHPRSLLFQLFARQSREGIHPRSDLTVVQA